MKHSLIALALAVALPFSAHASELSYTNIEADYVNLDNDADGWGLRGSFNFGTSEFYGLASYTNINVDTNFGDFDVDAYEVGVGYHHALTGKTDLLAEVAYQNADAGNVDIDGYRVSVGLRAALTQNFEGLIKANYVDGNDIDSDVTGTIGGLYKFNPTWGATGEVQFANGDTAYLVGVRASF